LLTLHYQRENSDVLPKGEPLTAWADVDAGLGKGQTDVFSGPQRFRFNRLGENIISKLTNDLTGQFADEIKPAEPLNYFIAQASATIEAGAPTLARKENSPIKHGLSAAAWASITPLGSGS
jgi:hypothetical protein